MTTAATTPAESRARTASAIILGADAVLAAHPATAVQLAHACLAAGYSTVIPPSWGDELLAAATVRLLQDRHPRPMVFCACPHVSARLLGVGDDLAPFLLPFVPPPVAAALHVRELARGEPLHITFVGACPGADDPAIDAHYTPTDFLAMLTARGIPLAEQPEVFDSVLPPDRRRHRSLPGGVPSAEVLWSEAAHRGLIEITDVEPMTELAQHLASGEPVLLDLGPALGCTCSGAVRDVPPRSARSAVSALEPPRSHSEVVEHLTLVQLVRPLRSSAAAPASMDRPVSVRRQQAADAADVATTAEVPVPDANAPTATTHPADTSGAVAPATDIPEGEPRVESDQGSATRKRTPGGGVRAVGSVVPTAQSAAGRSLPRAYVARRFSRRRSGATEHVAGGTTGSSGASASAPDTGRESEPVQRAAQEPAPPTPSPQPASTPARAQEDPPHRAADRPRNGGAPGRLFASVPIATPRIVSAAGPAAAPSPAPAAVPAPEREAMAGGASPARDELTPDPSAATSEPSAADDSAMVEDSFAGYSTAADSPAEASAAADITAADFTADDATAEDAAVAAAPREPEPAVEPSVPRSEPAPASEAAPTSKPAPSHVVVPGSATAPTGALRESARRFATRATERPEILGVLVLVVAAIGLVLGVAAARAFGGSMSVTADPAEHGARPDSLVGTSAPILIEEHDAGESARDVPGTAPEREAYASPERAGPPTLRDSASGSLGQSTPDDRASSTAEDRGDDAERRDDTWVSIPADVPRRDSGEAQRITPRRDSVAPGDTTVRMDAPVIDSARAVDSPRDSARPPIATTPADSLLLRERETLQRELAERQRKIDSLERWLDSARRAQPPPSPPPSPPPPTE